MLDICTSIHNSSSFQEVLLGEKGGAQTTATNVTVKKAALVKQVHIRQINLGLSLYKIKWSRYTNHI